MSIDRTVSVVVKSRPGAVVVVVSEAILVVVPVVMVRVTVGVELSATGERLAKLLCVLSITRIWRPLPSVHTHDIKNEDRTRLFLTHASVMTRAEGFAFKHVMRHSVLQSPHRGGLENKRDTGGTSCLLAKAVRCVVNVSTVVVIDVSVVVTADVSVSLVVVDCSTVAWAVCVDSGTVSVVIKTSVLVVVVVKGEVNMSFIVAVVVERSLAVNVVSGTTCVLVSSTISVVLVVKDSNARVVSVVVSNVVVATPTVVLASDTVVVAVAVVNDV